MYNNKGIGLAAPQIGQSIRLVVVDVGHGLISLANPVIIKMTGKMNSFEGCLSFPKKFFTVGRAKQIKVRGYDIFLRKEITLKYHGLEAAALQHEIDHLEGVLIIDRAKKQDDIT
jgi:peptide deformylase